MGKMKIYYACLISILAHFLFYQGLKKYASHLETLKQENVEVVLIDESKNVQVVMNPKTPKPDKLEPSDTDLFSEKNQQFIQQQKAANIGKTVNRSQEQAGEIAAQKDTQNRQENNQEDLVKKLKQINQLSNDVLSRLQQKKGGFDFDPSPLPSTVSVVDPISKIPVGHFTALNTNRYLYYSYYERINNQVHYRWVQHIRKAASRRLNIPAGKRSQEIWVTEIDVFLDEKGDFSRADVHNSSGIGAFDYAAIDAFREGTPIPNPPKGIIREDGLIHLRYAFHFYWRPKDYGL